MIRPPTIGTPPREYDSTFFNVHMRELSAFFDRINRAYPHNASTVNVDIDTLPTEADTANLRYGDVYRDTTVSDVLRVWRNGAVPWVWGGGGGAGATYGTATIDFATGANEASVAVIGQAGILVGSKPRAFIMADDTSVDHTAADHRYAQVLIGLTCGTPTAGVGFTIYGRCLDKINGKFSLRWEWA